MTIELRRTGATSISRRKPNSRSQTIDAAENIAVNMTAIARMPGYRKVRSDRPPVLPWVSRERPLPSTNRNRNGCTSEVDDPQPVGGEPDQLTLPDNLDGPDFADRRPRGHPHLGDRHAPRRPAGRASSWYRWRSSAASSKHRHGVAAALAGGRLGVADRGAGVGHEDVVQGRPGDAHRPDRQSELAEQPGHERFALFDGEGHRAFGRRSR